MPRSTTCPAASAMLSNPLDTEQDRLGQEHTVLYGKEFSYFWVNFNAEQFCFSGS